MLKKPGFLFLIIFCFSLNTALAEYRAYFLEVYDHIDEKKVEVKTGFSPDKYVLTHGGLTRISVLQKASWICRSDTSRRIPVCPMPPARKPLFKKGDSVKIKLDKHITQGWIGVVELSLYREDLKSNVYGVRFKSRRNLYNRYFEFNLTPVSQKK